MNCKEFETLVNDLARRQVMEAARRDAAHAHAKDCARCKARLTVEKQLTVGLRALAILDENQQASASLEANLLSAFRKNAEVAPQPNAAPASLLFASSPRSRRKSWWVAAAAVILIMLALVAWRIQNANQDVKAPEQNAGTQEPQPQKPPQNHKENPPPVLPNNSVAPPKSVAPVISNGGNKGKATPHKRSAKDLERLTARLAANASTDNVPTKQEAQTPDEITTPYISLLQGYTLPMSEGGQVMRVELPRSALAAFGLPVNAERFNERVKADVVVGNDGIARAIRFVR